MISARLPRPARLAAFTLAALFALGLGQTAHAQWKWKDKSGRVQYSDLPPPPNVSDAEILQRPSGSAARKPPPFAPNSAQAAVAAMAASAASASGSGAGVEPELEAKRRKAAEEEAAKRRAEEEKQRAARADNCQRARGQMRALEDGLRMARVNDKGEREILDDKARAEEMRRTREVIASDCK